VTRYVEATRDATTRRLTARRQLANEACRTVGVDSAGALVGLTRAGAGAGDAFHGATDLAAAALIGVVTAGHAASGLVTAGGQLAHRAGRAVRVIGTTVAGHALARARSGDAHHGLAALAVSTLAVFVTARDALVLLLAGRPAAGVRHGFANPAALAISVGDTLVTAREQRHGRHDLNRRRPRRRCRTQPAPSSLFPHAHVQSLLLFIDDAAPDPSQ
jgi:hypothetical protein